ncbi:MAG: hypothetical protein ACLRVN_02610 [Butyricicoccus sp.]
MRIIVYFSDYAPESHRKTQPYHRNCQRQNHCSKYGSHEIRHAETARETLNGSNTEFTGRISAVISKPAAAPITISADAIVSRHCGIVFRHSYSSSDTRTINTALTQICLRSRNAVKPVRPFTATLLRCSVLRESS